MGLKTCKYCGKSRFLGKCHCRDVDNKIPQTAEERLIAVVPEEDNYQRNTEIFKLYYGVNGTKYNCSTIGKKFNLKAEEVKFIIENWDGTN